MFLKIGDSVKTLILALIRIGLVGGGTVAVILTLLDDNLKSAFGVTNVYITIFFSSFFPMLFVLTVEIFCWLGRRSRKRKKNDMTYIKDTFHKKPLT
jgi:hypothetical protein